MSSSHDKHIVIHNVGSYINHKIQLLPPPPPKKEKEILQKQKQFHFTTT